VAAGRGLHEQGNPSGEGWTTIAVDRDTRAWSVAQALRQRDAAREAYEGLYRS
jgi:hypothetical protein